MDRISLIGSLLGVGLAACSVPGGVRGTPGAPSIPMAKLVLCNETKTSLRLQPNWLGVFPLGPGKCRAHSVPVGPALVTVDTITRPANYIVKPAARIDVPPTGAIARFTEMNQFIDLAEVRGTLRWARCTFPASFESSPPPPLNLTAGMVGNAAQPSSANSATTRGAPAATLRSELLRWMDHNLICDPGHTSSAGPR
jgi:hypothetical protein